jgi:hypothetical protein
MNGGHDKRVAKLEQERRPAARVLYVWCNAPTETTDEAIARSFPAGVPADTRLVIFSWQVAGEGESPIAYTPRRSAIASRAGQRETWASP